MSAAVTSLRILCSSCTLKGERIRASNHIVFKNGVIKTVHELRIQGSFSLFHSFYHHQSINNNNNNNKNNNNTEVVQELFSMKFLTKMCLSCKHWYFFSNQNSTSN
jgi:hypothetical protein